MWKGKWNVFFFLLSENNLSISHELKMIWNIAFIIQIARYVYVIGQVQQVYK